MKPIAVTALIYQSALFNSPILGVSRKHDPTDFGIVGGKLEKNETVFDGIKREVLEETGLVVTDAIPLFFREENDFFTLVYLVLKYTGELFTKEAGKVEWVNFDTLKKGSFGVFNTQLEQFIYLMKQSLKN